MSGFNLSVEILMVQAPQNRARPRGPHGFNLSVEILMVQACAVPREPSVVLRFQSLSRDSDGSSMAGFGADEIFISVSISQSRF